MACALQSGVSEETIKEWHKILVTGDFYNTDKSTMLAGRSIIRFRDVAEQLKRASLNSYSFEDAITLIKKTMTSIYYFDKKISVTKLYGSFVYPDIKV
jgi:hypothetical protein